MMQTIGSEMAAIGQGYGITKEVALLDPHSVLNHANPGPAVLSATPSPHRLSNETHDYTKSCA
jgi:hypothetical protein